MNKNTILKIHKDKKEDKAAGTRTKPHHDLDLPLAHLEVMLVVDKHSFQGTFHPVACSHQKDEGESACEEAHGEALLSNAHSQSGPRGCCHHLSCRSHCCQPVFKVSLPRQHSYTLGTYSLSQRTSTPESRRAITF